MCMALISREFENGFLFVCDEAFADSGRDVPAEEVARVGHGEVFAPGFVGCYPGHHVDDLLAVDVDDAEGGSFLDGKGIAVAARYDVLVHLSFFSALDCRRGGGVGD